MSDFTNIVDQGGVFSSVELDDGVDFVLTGDQGVVIITASEYGYGAYGQGPYGGDVSIVINSATTPWVNIDTP